MILNRQKILLSYILVNGGKVSPLHLMKALFIFCTEYSNSIYDFHPYKRGPFSELVYLDLRKLEEKGIISQQNYTITISKDPEVMDILKNIDSISLYQLIDISGKYGKLKDQELMLNIYHRYPYYAINNPDYTEEFSDFDPRNNPELKKSAIFTIGYEGKSIDAYLNKLIGSNITTLVDIRKNPQSMKYGFTGSRLKEIVEKRGIKYISIRELGIEGEDRKELFSQADYESLFSIYRKDLPNRKRYIEEIGSLIKGGDRIALTCFEADYRSCHRREVADYLFNFLQKEYDLTHI